MAPVVNTNDLIDANRVAKLLGLAHRNSVTTYLRRYPDMPRPVVDLGWGSCRLWRRSDIQAWLSKRTQARARGQL